MRQHPAIGDRPGNTGREGGATILPQLGVDAVRRDDDVAFGDRAVGERYTGDVAGLLKADAAMAGVHHAGRQRASASISTRSARCMPNVAFQPDGVRHLNRRDGRTVVAEILRLGADPGAPFLHRGPESHPLQLAHAVRRQEYPGADLAERGRLLVDRDPKPWAISAFAANKPPIPPPTTQP